MRVLILAFCGMLLVGSTAAFLLYVSILSILSVVVTLSGMMFMFVLGIYVERKRSRVREIPSESAVPRMQGAHTQLDLHVEA